MINYLEKFDTEFRKLDWKTLFVLGQGMGTTNFILQLLDSSLNQYKTEQTALFKKLFNLNAKVLYIKKNTHARDQYGEPEIKKLKEFSKIHPVSFINYNESTSFEKLYKTIEGINFNYVIIDDVKLLLNHKKYFELVDLIEKKQIKFIVGFNSSEPQAISTYGISKYLRNIDILIHLNVNISENCYEIDLSSYLKGNYFTKNYSISLK